MKKMRRVCALSVCSAMAVSMFGCSDGDKDKKNDSDTKEKTEKIDDSDDQDEESSVNESKDNEDKKETNENIAPDDQFVDVIEETDAVEPTIASTGSEASYSLEGMTAAQIQDLINDFRTVEDGMNWNEYIENLEYEPSRQVDSAFSFNTDEYRNWLGDKDCLVEFFYPYSEINDDGTITFDKEKSYLKYLFYLSDREMAEAYFWEAYNAIDASVEGLNSISDTEGESTWLGMWRNDDDVSIYYIHMDPGYNAETGDEFIRFEVVAPLIYN